MSNIKDKVVVITGASSRIGEAAARLLAQRDAKLMLAARREDRLRAVSDEIEQAGGTATYQVTDVTDRVQVQGLADAALERYGRIDVLVNNAGLMPLSSLHLLKVDEWDHMIDVNIKGVLYGIAAVLPHMRSRKQGHIINMSSIVGHKCISEYFRLQQFIARPSTRCVPSPRVYVKNRAARSARLISRRAR